MNSSDNVSPLATATKLATALGTPPDLLQELFLLHARQWRLEDETRGKGVSVHGIAAGKKEIDDCNARRHRLIDAIDASVAVATASQPARYYSETVGELCDRLLILDLKQRALADSGAPCNLGENASPDGRISAQRSVSRLCRHLVVVVAQLIDDFAAGRAALPPRAGVKVYNGWASREDHMRSADGLATTRDVTGLSRTRRCP